MTTDEKLDFIISELTGVKQEIQELKQRVSRIEVHTEEVTDKNIQLLAENFLELNRKLDQVISMAERNYAYEIKVEYLVEKVDRHEEEIKEIKMRLHNKNS